ncbi:hypothetical protein JCM8097_008178 [Rhodosporidiobolus ruineniae]
MASLLQSLQERLQDPSIPWQAAVLGVVVLALAFEEGIRARQRPYLSSILHPSLPAALKPYLSSFDQPEDSHRKSQAYASAKLRFASIFDVLDTLEIVVLLTGVAGPVVAALFGPDKVQGEGWTLLKGFWDAAGALLPARQTGEIKQSMTFVALMTLVGSVLAIPKDWYKHFRLEEEHGFNKMTVATFWKDWIKGLLLSLALEVPLIAGLIKCIHYAGQDAILRIVTYTIAFMWVALSMLPLFVVMLTSPTSLSHSFCVQLVMVPAYPALIQPLFNTFTLLPEDSPVFPRVKALAEKLKFPLGKVWIINGSLRSSHSNAYFYGLPGFNKNIVIFDTLLEKSSPDEVEAILAHELGHWKGNHIPVLLVTGLARLAFSLICYSIFLTNRPLLAAFGFPRSSSGEAGPTIIALFLAATLFTPLSAFLTFLTNTVTRALEYDADAFAAKLSPATGENLKGALIAIHRDNAAVYEVDPVYSAYHHNHPTLVERLQALDARLEKEK